MKKIAREGFTLIEIICVIAIIVILGALSFPSIKQMIDINQLDIATNQLISDLRLGKIYAITNPRCEVRVKFDLGQSEGVFIGYEIYYSKQNSDTLYLVKRTFMDQIIIDGRQSTFMNGGMGSYLEFSSIGNVNMACSIVLKDLLNNRCRTVTLTIGYTRIEAI